MGYGTNTPIIHGKIFKGALWNARKDLSLSQVADVWTSCPHEKIFSGVNCRRREWRGGEGRNDGSRLYFSVTTFREGTDTKFQSYSGIAKSETIATFFASVTAFVL